MKRSEVINSLATLNNAKNYLEIGVEAGITFSEVQIERKTAVDPVFRFDKNKFTNCEFFEEESDVFFKKAISGENKYDIIFLDGLHLLEFIMRDFLNSTYLSHEKTIIIIDDVIPTDYISQIRSRHECANLKEQKKFIDRNWMGDVYKIIPYIELIFCQWSYATITSNHGQTILWQEPRIPVSKNIADYTYYDILTNKINYNIMHITDILVKINCQFSQIK